jgi:predicted dinucleotide-binding enzyme
VYDQPTIDGQWSEVSVVGDDAVAKKEFLGLVNGSPSRYLAAGRLANARIVERMTLFSGELGQRQGFFPRMNWRLVGEPCSVGRADTVKHLITREHAGACAA